MIDYQTIKLADNKILEYALALPAGFDPARPYPVLLAFPPGLQSRDMVAWGLSSYWLPEARRRGWLVVSPAAPHGVLFFKGAEALIPEFLQQIAAQVTLEGDKFHLAGISNGGISSFRIALNNPELFHSITVLPGFPPTDADMDNLAVLKNIPVNMFVGQQDTVWVDKMKAAQIKLTELGGSATLEVVSGEGHVIQRLAGGQELFDLLDSLRPNQSL
ncbi:MAG: hypothetical protein KDI79_05035 [Anaerolineae bacterium]|nr:hypothetical protein [Anaerolineae bacterium]